SSGRMGSKSCPSAPRPCIQITAAVGAGAVSISIASRSWSAMGRGREYTSPAARRATGGRSCRAHLIDTRSGGSYRRGRERNRRAPTGRGRRPPRLARRGGGGGDISAHIVSTVHDFFY